MELEERTMGEEAAKWCEGKVATTDILPGQQLTDADFKPAGNGVITKLDAEERETELAKLEPGKRYPAFVHLTGDGKPDDTALKQAAEQSQAQAERSRIEFMVTRRVRGDGGEVAGDRRFDRHGVRRVRLRPAVVLRRRARLLGTRGSRSAGPKGRRDAAAGVRLAAEWGSRQVTRRLVGG